MTTPDPYALMYDETHPDRDTEDESMTDTNSPIWIVVEGGIAEPFDPNDYGRVVILDFDNMEQDPDYAAETANDPSVPEALREQAAEYMREDENNPRTDDQEA